MTNLFRSDTGQKIPATVVISLFLQGFHLLTEPHRVCNHWFEQTLTYMEFLLKKKS